jgi:hypothetical protein
MSLALMAGLTAGDQMQPDHKTPHSADPAPDKFDPNRPETEEDGYKAGEMRIAKMLRNNPQKMAEALQKVRAVKKT